MANLADLLETKGVIAALRFYDDGSLMEAVGKLEALHDELAAQLCHANGRIMHHGSDMLAAISGKTGWPPRGWMMIGDELSICTIANVVCFANNAEVSFNAALNELAKLESQ